MFPLSPAPLSLSHINGTMCVTNKAMLIHKLELKAQSVKDIKPEAVTIDFLFLLCSQAPFLPLKYGDIARQLLVMARHFGAIKIFIVADGYVSESSIKDSCQVNWWAVGDCSFNKNINHSQSCPVDFAGALESDNFKNAFFTFLADEWNSENCANLITGYFLHFAYYCSL